jgi:hypothetical protein
MTENTIVFMHVGIDPNIELFVESLRAADPSSRIIQCSDKNTARIRGVTDMFRYDGDITNLMTFRLEIFSALAMQSPAFYIDTDILMLRQESPRCLLRGNEVAVCKREYGSKDLININFKGLNLQEYRDKTFGEIYPYVACCTITENSNFWNIACKVLSGLDKKFHTWYGDQEAIRICIQNQNFSYKEIPESVYGCLPENYSEQENPVFLHFKGPSRKALMPKFFKNLIVKS